MYISSICVTSYRLNPRPRCVQYALTVRGLTPYLHPMCLYDADSCLTHDYAVFTHWKRFSEIARFHKALRSDLPDIRLPALPRHWFPVRTQRGLQTRQRKLGLYFAALMEIERVKFSVTLMNFLQPGVKLRVKIAGEPGVGKMRLIEAFFNVKHYKEEEGVPGLYSGRFQESGCYPDRAEFPVDMVVEQTLVRITLIEVVSLTKDTDPNFTNTDSIIFVFSSEMPSSLSLVRKKRREVDIDSAIVALDESPSLSQGQFSISSLSDVYIVFEYLVRRHLRHRGPVTN